MLRIRTAPRAEALKGVFCILGYPGIDIKSIVV